MKAACYSQALRHFPRKWLDLFAVVSDKAGVPRSPMTRGSSLVTPRRAARDIEEAEADAAAATAAEIARQKGDTGRGGVKAASAVPDHPSERTISESSGVLSDSTTEYGSSTNFTRGSGEPRGASKDLSHSEASGDLSSDAKPTGGSLAHVLSTTPQSHSGRSSSPWEQSPSGTTLMTLNARQSFAKTGREDSGLSEMSGGTDMDESGTRPT